MLEVPDTLKILNDPVRIEPGAPAALRLELNAKNDFLPKHADALSVVLAQELAGKVAVAAKGRLLGGKVRVTLEASDDAPLTTASMRVALVVPELGVLLTADGSVEVAEAQDRDEEDSRSGGEPNIEVSWIGRDKWDSMEPAFDAETAGVCFIERNDTSDPTAITKVTWVMNESVAPYEHVISEKRLGEEALKTFREGYSYPVLFGIFKQTLAEEAKETEADERGEPIEIPDDYVRGERARMARAVLMAMEPDIKLAEAAEPAAAIAV